MIYCIYIFAVIGFIVTVLLLISIVLNTINAFKNQKLFKEYAEKLKNSGFIEDSLKQIDSEEREDMESTGKGGKTVSYNLKTGEKTVENKRRTDK